MNAAQTSSRRKMIIGIRIGIALVWFVFGLVFKVFNVVPRHREIVATVLGPELGDDLAGPLTVMIGLAEVGVGVWMLSGWRPRTCATLQTIALVAMITLAKEHLLAPVPMVCANAVFLGLVWWAALGTVKLQLAAVNQYT